MSLSRPKFFTTNKRGMYNLESGKEESREKEIKEKEGREERNYNELLLYMYLCVSG